MKRLLLAGGGHAHVEVLRRFAQRRPDGVELIVVSPEPESPYSGMLPGHVAGFYAREEIFIDVARLAAACGARFVRSRIAALDAGARGATLEDGTRLSYDLLSLDVGSTPSAGCVPGAREHALPLKPIPAFLEAWHTLLGRATQGGVRCVAVAGAGAAGVEMLLAMRHALAATAGAGRVEWHLLTDAPEILPGLPPRVRSIFDAVLAARGVAVHRGTPVAAVAPDALRTAAGLELPADATVWATGAAAPAWLAGTRLALDDAGFVAIEATLQSVSHPEVFAAGDVASMVGAPRPKSGVYAVRQGPPLARNLAAALAGAPLERYVPQRRALALITTGDRCAVATRGRVALAGRWVWRWKDRIDRRFMARYRL